MKIIFNRCFIIFCFVLVAFTNVQAQKLKVGLIPIGKINSNHLAMAKESLESFYHAKVIIAAELPVNSRITSKSSNEKLTAPVQILNAEAINRELSQLNLTKFDVIIGITDSALTIGETLFTVDKNKLNQWLIRGIAEDTLKIATISTYKLIQEAKNEQAFKEDLSKVTRHEMGHILGVEHCNKSKQCLMLNAHRFTNSTDNFCDYCLAKVDKKYLKRKKADTNSMYTSTGKRSQNPS